LETLDHSVLDELTSPGLHFWVWMGVDESLGDSHVWIGVHWSFNSFWDGGVSGKDKDEEDDTLERSLTENVFDHSLVDDVFLLSVWWSLEKLSLWQFSSKSEGSKGVHDQVDPQKLDGSEWRVLQDDGSNKRDDESDNVDGQLEL